MNGVKTGDRRQSKTPISVAITSQNHLADMFTANPREARRHACVGLLQWPREMAWGLSGQRMGSAHAQRKKR